MAVLTDVKYESLRDLFERQFCSIYDAELQQLDPLGQLAGAASEPQLAGIFDRHHTQTRLQSERLAEMASSFGLPLKRVACQAMEGLLADAAVTAGATGCDKVRDAGLIVAWQGIEHYEISAYGSLRTFAELLGLAELQQPLQQILDEESATDGELSELAESHVNVHAARESL